MFCYPYPTCTAAGCLSWLGNRAAVERTRTSNSSELFRAVTRKLSAIAKPLDFCMYLDAVAAVCVSAALFVVYICLIDFPTCMGVSVESTSWVGFQGLDTTILTRTSSFIFLSPGA